MLVVSLLLHLFPATEEVSNPNIRGNNVKGECEGGTAARSRREENMPETKEVKQLKDMGEVPKGTMEEDATSSRQSTSGSDEIQCTNNSKLGQD